MEWSTESQAMLKANRTRRPDSVLRVHVHQNFIGDFQECCFRAMILPVSRLQGRLTIIFLHMIFNLSKHSSFSYFRDKQEITYRAVVFINKIKTKLLKDRHN